MRPDIRVVGLRDTIRALRAVDQGLPKAMREANKKAADEVVKVALPLAGRAFRSRSGRARGSIKALASQRDARVKGGSSSVPYFGWLDFGGRVGHRDTAHRPFLREGRILRPAVKQARPRVLAEYEKSVGALLRQAGM